MVKKTIEERISFLEENVIKLLNMVTVLKDVVTHNSEEKIFPESLIDYAEKNNCGVILVLSRKDGRCDLIYCIDNKYAVFAPSICGDSNLRTTIFEWVKQYKYLYFVNKPIHVLIGDDIKIDPINVPAKDRLAPVVTHFVSSSFWRTIYPETS